MGIINKVKEKENMIKLTKTIVDTNKNLIGFMAEGKEKEFGGFSTDRIERGIPTDNIIQMKLNNNQITVSNGKIAEKSNFRINSLPMVVYAENKYIPVDNTVNIVKRFIKDNENFGFRVHFSDGSEENLRYEALLYISKWFKPGNFIIRTSKTNRQYICGKNGVSLDDIPAELIGQAPEKATKRLRSAAKDKESEINGIVESGFDILDIYNFIDSCHGCIIKLPNEDYVATTSDGETTTEGFTSLCIGEVASPKPIFSATKLNVNAGFKKVGVVEVAINGTTSNVTSYVYRVKSIFNNGENYIKRFGIAVPTDKEEELIKKLGGSLALEKITDPTITGPLGQVIDAKALTFYRVDTSNIDLISKDKRKSSILSAKQITNLCRKRYELKLIEKAMGPKGGLMKNLKASLGDDGVAKAKKQKVAGAYAMYSKEGLLALKEAGIDIYTGAYTVPGKPAAKGEAGAKTEDAAASVEIEYILNGYDANKLTGSKILDAVRANNTEVVSESVIKYVSAVLEISDLEKQYAAASALYNKVQNEGIKLNKKLWMHNASMYLDGNKSRIHTHDTKKWSVDSSSRVKTATVYKCNEKGCEGLSVKFKGVTI
jgi:hypothetical protein